VKLLCLLVTICTAASAAPQGATRIPEAHQGSRLQVLLSAIREAAGAPGGVLVLADGRSIRRVVSGVANKATHAPMRSDRRFRIASISKTFLAAVVLQLVAERRLSLDDTVDRWLPGQVPDGSRITIRELLNHTSGLVEGSVGAQEPGHFEYANENYIVLGSIVEAATGSGFRDAEKSRIFRPLHLNGTLWPTAAVVRRMARGYSGFTGNDATAIDPATRDASNGVVSTANDVRRFLTALFDGRLLPPAEVTAMETAVPVGARYSAIYDGYGLGLMFVRTQCGSVWGHRGRETGYTSFAFASPNGRKVIVVLLNVGGADDAFVVRVQKLVLDAFCGTRLEVNR
jgi:D-alanyl-D-alanine carboxypeptidase